MKKQNMIGTDLEVSVMALGTGGFGTKVSKEQAFSQMDLFLEQGGNFIDTALVYGDWGDSGIKSISEKIIGEWFQSRKNRNDVILSTKGGHPLWETMDVTRVLIPELEQDLNESLRNLQTECIDLYFLHRDNVNQSVESILDWLEAQVKKGKIRYYGCSNWSLERIEEAENYAKSRGYQGFSCNQTMCSLAKPNEAELIRTQMTYGGDEILAYHEKKKLPLMAYMAQAQGYFAKRFQGAGISQDTADMFQNEENEKMFQKLRESCSTVEAVNRACYQYVFEQKFPAFVIAGFSSNEQLLEGVKFCQV